MEIKNLDFALGITVGVGIWAIMSLFIPIKWWSMPSSLLLYWIFKLLFDRK